VQLTRGKIDLESPVFGTFTNQVGDHKNPTPVLNKRLVRGEHTGNVSRQDPMPLRDYFRKGIDNVGEVIGEFKISFVMLLISGYNNFQVSVVYIAFQNYISLFRQILLHQVLT
jgi:hypothetical protein